MTIFGVMIGLDRAWLPRWDVNVLGWSYGLVVVSGFFSVFSFIAIVVYTLARKYDLTKEQMMARGEASPIKTKAKLMPKV